MMGLGLSGVMDCRLVMEMQQVRYFLAVAEELNFSRAAERCKVSQPSLSRAIQSLEAELGGELFRREGRNTHLSELGQMVRPHLEMVFRATASAKRISHELATMNIVPLKLGIMSTIAPDEIVDLIAALKEKHPGLELKLSDASAHELRARLLSGELEAAIYALPGEATDEIHVMPLFREQMVIAVHRDHKLSRAPSFPVRAMNGESYIHRMNCEFAGYADRILNEQGVTCTPTYWSERDDWTLAMVAAGLGFAFMPVRAVKHPGVIGVPVVEPEFWRNVNLVTVRGRRHSPGIGALVREAMRKKWYGGSAIATKGSDRRAHSSRSS
jgi:LysR family transcriptional regulator, hydrogen peroxide-inducible genes activator